MIKSSLFLFLTIITLGVYSSDTVRVSHENNEITDLLVIDIQNIRRIPRVNSSPTIQKEVEEYFEKVIIPTVKIVVSTNNSDTDI